MEVSLGILENHAERGVIYNNWHWLHEALARAVWRLKYFCFMVQLINMLLNIYLYMLGRILCNQIE